MTEPINKYRMKCLVVDDEPMAREGVIDYIDRLDFLEVKAACSSALEASSYLQQASVDLLFLDINMPYLSGMEFLESLDNAPLTILTTAYSEYALEGFRLQVADYLLKPFSFKRFHQAVTKAHQIFISRNSFTGAMELAPFLYIRQGDAYHKINWKDILYAEGMQNYVKLHFIKHTLIIHQTMSSLEESLPKSLFFRAHKSFLVNILHIDSVAGGRIFIGKHEVPVSRQKKEELLNTVVYKNLLGQ